MISFRAGNYRSLAVSLLLHALLLVLLTMFVIRPMLTPRWYEFELTPPELLPAEVTTTPGPGALQPQTQASPVKPAATQSAKPKTQTVQPEKPAVTTPQAQPPARGELLETPAVAATTLPKPVSIPSNPLNPLRGIPTGRPGGATPGGSVNYSLSGGGARFQQPAGYKHDLGAAGRVILTFRLDQNARPVLSSIESMEQSGPRFFEAAKKLLQAGKFSFTGSPNPNTEYTITIDFIL